MNYPIIDCHCHIYPDKIAAKAAAATGKFYGINMYFNGTADELKTAGSEAGINHYVVFSVATTPKQVSSINNFVADLVAENPSSMTGLGTLHPDSTDLKGDVQKIIELGLHGVKLHPDIQGFKIDDYRCLKIYELCEGRLPILMHTGDKRYDMSNPNRLKPILETYTDLTVIAAHLGGYSVWDDAVSELADFKNIYFDSSSSLAFLEKEKAVEIIRRYGADKVMFGVDYPMWSPKEEVQRFLDLGLSHEENEKILYKNAANFFKITV